MRAHRPIGIPVGIESPHLPALRSATAGGEERTARRLALTHDLAVVLDPERVRPEDECVLPVIECIEEDLDRVCVVEVGIAAALADDDLVGRRVVADDGNVESAAIDQEPDLGPLRGGLAFVRLLLDERAVGLRERPDRLFDAPVDLRTLTVDQTADGELWDFLSCRQRRDD